MKVQRLLAVCTLLLLSLTPGRVAGQTPVPAGDTDPIDFVFTSYPRQVVYLGVDPGASAFVTLLAYDTVIPAGLTPDYSCDVDGDGAFTQWFFRDDCGEKVTMAGPFVATMRVRAAAAASRPPRPCTCRPVSSRPPTWMWDSRTGPRWRWLRAGRPSPTVTRTPD